MDHAALARRALSPAQGFRVTHVRTGAEAMDALSKEAFDVCVLDWRLPDTEGVKLCRELRAAGHAFPIILVTSTKSESLVRRALEAGANDYVLKESRYGERLADGILVHVGGASG